MSKKIYQWDAEDYKRNSSAQFSWGRELLSKIEFRGNERVLDIGCGVGKITAEIAEKVPRGFVTGIDNSASMIKTARERYAVIYHNLRFDQLDAADLPYEDEFDVVFSNAALHWIKDQKAVIAGISRSLHTGGRLVMQMGGKGNAGDLFDIVRLMGQEEKWIGYFGRFDIPYTFCTPEEYRHWLLAGNLCPQRVELRIKDMVHKGKYGLAGWLRPVSLPFLDKLPGELHDSFIEEMVTRYLAYYPEDEEGMTHVRMVRLEVEAARC